MAPPTLVIELNGCLTLSYAFIIKTGKNERLGQGVRYVRVLRIDQLSTLGQRNGLFVIADVCEELTVVEVDGCVVCIKLEGTFEFPLCCRIIPSVICFIVRHRVMSGSERIIRLKSFSSIFTYLWKCLCRWQVNGGGIEICVRQPRISQRVLWVNSYSLV